MKAKEITLEFVNENFYNIGEIIYRKDGRKCTKHSNGKYYTIFLKKHYVFHRILWILYNQQKIPEGYFIDHKNGDTTNNSKDNLRLSTHSENNRNRKINKNTTTRVKGVYIRKLKKYIYYCSVIKKDKTIFQKCFPYTPSGLESAKMWLEEKRKELHGEFARSC